jgi:hypothetical protein
MFAYGGRCAVSGLPESRLLDAAHIVADADETLGHAVVPNGIPLSKIHHAAFDAHLIGIDPDYKLHVSPQLLEQNDGPMLEGLKKLQGVSVQLPRRANCHRMWQRTESVRRLRATPLSRRCRAVQGQHEQPGRRRSIRTETGCRCGLSGLGRRTERCYWISVHRHSFDRWGER